MGLLHGREFRECDECGELLKDCICEREAYFDRLGIEKPKLSYDNFKVNFSLEKEEYMCPETFQKKLRFKIVNKDGRTVKYIRG